MARPDLPRSAGPPCYEQLNRVLVVAGFEALGEEQCAKLYADGVGRPNLGPGRYFRMLLLGYSEGLESECAMAWRAADSLNPRQFLVVALHEAPSDHSTGLAEAQPSRRQDAAGGLTWVLRRLADAEDLLKGKTVGIDTPTLEANAALRSLVRRETGEGYEAFLRGLAAASAIPTPTRAYLARLDRKGPKRGSNHDWTHPHDPDAKITGLNDGRTPLAHKADHAVDLQTGAGVGGTVQDANSIGTTTMIETQITASEQVEAALPASGGVAEVVRDRERQSDDALAASVDLGLRSYMSELDRGRRRRRGEPAARAALYANRRRIHRRRRLRLRRPSGEPHE